MLPCQDAPKGVWEVWVGTVGVGGTPGNGVWWWQMGHCRSSPLPRLCGSSSSPPSPAQHPGPDHSCCLTWKRNSREAPTRFSRCHLKHDLAFGKSNQSRVTVRFCVCSYRERWDAICKYLFWIISLCPTGLFGARQSWGGQPACPAVCPAPLGGSGRRKYHSPAPRSTDLCWLTDFHPQKCFPHSAVLLVRVGNIKAEPCALLGSEDRQKFGD